MTGIVFQIQRFCVHDGPGIRTTVFLKGCPLRCRWCHNPEGLRHESQLAYRADRCTGCGGCARACTHGVHRLDGGHEVNFSACVACGACTRACPAGALSIIGQRMTAEAVLAEVLRDMPFYGREGGVTFSGGECCMQPAFLLELLKKSKASGLHTAVDTCGAVPWDTLAGIAPYTDCFLYDLKSPDADVHRRMTGADHTFVFENYARLKGLGAQIEVRIPIIPGVNDSEAALEAIFDFLKQKGKPWRIRLIPYHSPGEKKYEQLGMRLWEPAHAGDFPIAAWQTKANLLCMGGCKQ